MPFFPGNLLLFEQQQSLNPFEEKAAVMLKNTSKMILETPYVYFWTLETTICKEKEHLETRKKINLSYRADVMRQC